MGDVIIVGAGLTGCSCAIALARAGLKVLLLERGQIGEHGASSAAAGMLGAQLERHPDEAMQQLCLLSRARYGDWIEQLGEGAAAHSEYRVSGSLRVAATAREVERLRAEVAQQQRDGLRAQWLRPDELTARVAALSASVRSGYVQGAAWYPDDGLIDPPALLAASLRCARRLGVEVREGQQVAELLMTGRRRIGGVVLADGTRLTAGEVVVTAGSWSSLLGGLAPLGLARDAVVPVRGQLVQLKLERPAFEVALEGPGAYLSPRADGRVLVGATVERVGFERALVPQAIEQLIAAATKLVPSLAEAERVVGWCGFRAATADLRPLFDDTLARGLTLCSGHYRNGVLLAPVSAAMVSAMLLGTTPPLAPEPFRLQRLLDRQPRAAAAESVSPPRVARP